MPHLFRVLNADRPTDRSVRWKLEGLHELLFGHGQPPTTGRSPDGRRLGVLLDDEFMSRDHARLAGIQGQWILEDRGSKNGTYVNGRRCQKDEKVRLADGDVVEMGHTFFLFRAAEVVLAEDEWEYSPPPSDPLAPLLVSLTSALRARYEELKGIVASTVPVVVTGETGTGKEVVARAVHALSDRAKKGSFVAVNCGALAPNLVESQLFGHVKGAFTDAIDERPGLVRGAHRGTLFLDEIAELPSAAQPKLLRVLQEREVLPVGGAKPVAVDVRLVCATHQDLPELVEQGTFREDLFARIEGFPLHLPPLRDRIEDLGLLITALLHRLAGDRAKAVVLDAEAARALLLYRWPRNIRELEKVIHAAVAAAGQGPITLGHLPEPVRESLRHDAPTRRSLSGSDDESLKGSLMESLQEHDGNISAVARAMGKDPKQIRRWLQRFGLKAEDFHASADPDDSESPPKK